jgi:hypothetical protein
MLKYTKKSFKNKQKKFFFMMHGCRLQGWRHQFKYSKFKWDYQVAQL